MPKLEPLQHIDSFRFRHLAEEFVATAVAACNEFKVVLLATSASTSSLHPLLSTCHLFGDQVSLKPPDKNGRKAVRLHSAKVASSADVGLRVDRPDPDEGESFSFGPASRPAQRYSGCHHDRRLPPDGFEGFG